MTRNGFIWNVTTHIPIGSQIIVTPDGMLLVRGPDDAPIYTAKFRDDDTWRLDPIDDELIDEERPPVGSRWWHRGGKWLTIVETPNERGWPADEVMAVDDDGQRYGVKVKSLSEAP